MNNDFERAIQALVTSENAAVYAYGVIAGNVHKVERKHALVALAEHRRLRNELLALANDMSIETTPAQLSYDLPIEVRNHHTAVTAATEIERALGALWAISAGGATDATRSEWSINTQECAKRAYRWSHVNPAFLH